MKTTLIFIISVIAICIVSIGYGMVSTTHITEETGTITKLVEQQKISGSKESLKTKIRYLIITENDTYISESSMLNGKFDNSDVFFHLKEGKRYKFKLSGYGKNLILDYKNVLEATEVEDVPKPKVVVEAEDIKRDSIILSAIKNEK